MNAAQVNHVQVDNYSHYVSHVAHNSVINLITEQSWTCRLPEFLNVNTLNYF